MKGLSPQAQVVLGCGVVYLLFSFFNWQQVSGFGVTVGRSEWSGFGIVAGLVAVVLVAWEAGRMLGVKVPVGGLSEGLVSVGLALLLALVTVITFLTHGTARHWPAWIGLILAIVIAVAALGRARAEGVEMPTGSAAVATPTGSAPPPEAPTMPEAPPAPEE